MAAELQIFKTPLFDLNDLRVSNINDHLAFRINDKRSLLTRDNVIALSNKLHEWLSETAPDVEWSAIAFNGPTDDMRPDGLAMGAVKGRSAFDDLMFATAGDHETVYVNEDVVDQEDQLDKRFGA